LLLPWHPVSSLPGIREAGRRSPVAGRRSPVAGCRLPVAGRRSPVAGCRLPVAGCRLPVAGRRSPVAGCRLPVAGCRLPVAGIEPSSLTGHQWGGSNPADQLGVPRHSGPTPLDVTISGSPGPDPQYELCLRRHILSPWRSSNDTPTNPVGDLPARHPGHKRGWSKCPGPGDSGPAFRDGSRTPP